MMIRLGRLTHRFTHSGRGLRCVYPSLLARALARRGYAAVRSLVGPCFLVLTSLKAAVRLSVTRICVVAESKALPRRIRPVRWRPKRGATTSRGIRPRHGPRGRFSIVAGALLQPVVQRCGHTLCQQQQSARSVGRISGHPVVAGRDFVASLQIPIEAATPDLAARNNALPGTHAVDTHARYGLAPSHRRSGTHCLPAIPRERPGVIPWQTRC